VKHNPENNRLASNIAGLFALAKYDLDTFLTQKEVFFVCSLYPEPKIKIKMFSFYWILFFLGG